MKISMRSESGRAETTYDAAADDFDERPLSLRDRFGERTVVRLNLPAGAEVLDVGCGTGASAIPAALRVGREGWVIGVDLSARMVTRAWSKAWARGVRNLEFRVADMGALAFADGAFDAVISGFSIFFAPDMVAQARELWRLVRPGGRLAITTWGPDAFEPALTAWRRAVERLCPDIIPDPLPRDRLSDLGAVRRLLSDAGIAKAEVVAEKGHQALRSPEDWWTIVLGTGARRIIDRMTPRQAELVKNANLAWLRENRVVAVETNVIYAVATKARCGRSSP
jgi:ubiquinone/menaquinone biosynthesis C-methylase UbiE